MGLYSAIDGELEDGDGLDAGNGSLTAGLGSGINGAGDVVVLDGLRNGSYSGGSRRTVYSRTIRPLAQFISRRKFK